MTRRLMQIVFAGAALLVPQAAGAGPQLGTLGKIGAAASKVQQMRDLQVSEAEEIQLGAAVSERIRQRYGVVQDARVHRYVSLVGRVLAEKSTRPALTWTFIVLDTDGVNAFAAPGGYVHVTRGALALMRSESELAGVLAHELMHVTAKHTIRAIQKGRLVQMGANETLGSNAALFSKVVETATNVVLAGFGRNDELESDSKGLVLANAVGYAPQGLGAFLTTLQARNRNASAKAGLFASHPEMQERLDKAASAITAGGLTSSVTLADRYAASISYRPAPVSGVTSVAAGAAGLAGGGSPAPKGGAPSPAPAPADAPKKRGFNLGALVKPGGDEKQSAQVTGSGAARGADTERDARGGSNPSPVTVTLAPADVAAFRKAGGLK